MSALQRLRNATRQRNMIVLDQYAVRQIEAVIESAAAHHAIFIEDAKARDSFARIENADSGSGNGIHELARERRDSAQPLQYIQDDALTREQHPCIVANNGDRLA